MNTPLPLVAVADIHGHLTQLNALVAWLDTNLGPHVLIPLGDYCDNGPDVPGLLERLIDLRLERGDRMRPILGNHDLACLRALEDDFWFNRWGTRYWNPGGATPEFYGAQDARSFRARFPSHHRNFLASLPWVLELDGHVFVHAGLHPGSIKPQIDSLTRRELPSVRELLPPPIRDKSLATVCDPNWDRFVVSAHHGTLPNPWFLGPNRICLRAEIEHTGRLHAAILPAGRFLTVDPQGHVNESAAPINLAGAWRIGSPEVLGQRRLFPLSMHNQSGPKFTTLGAALHSGQAAVRDQGGVRDLRIENRGPLPILCLEGELLKGGRQDRVLDRPAWIGPGEDLALAVSCVEQGRWHGQATDFRAASVMVDPALRSARLSAESESARQQTTWERVAERRRASGLTDPAGSLVEDRCLRPRRLSAKA
ncbi:MAG: DUF6569 family protein [Pseudomonadota bacterium]